MLRKIKTRVSNKLENKFVLKRDIDRITDHISRLESLVGTSRDRLHSNTFSKFIRIDENIVLVKLFNGQKIYVDTRDIAVAPHIILDGIWEPTITAAWNELMKTSEVVIDIGANFGYFGLLSTAGATKTSKIIMFEPNPQLVECIEKTIALNWITDRATIEPLAVSRKSGDAELNILEDYIGCSSLSSMEHLHTYLDDVMKVKLQKKLKVRAVSIDDYCEEKSIKYVDLIKLDIEGFEEEAYMGMRDTIIRSHNLKLFIEFTERSYKDPKKFYDRILTDFGNVSTIDESGNIVDLKRSSYSDLPKVDNGWIMLIFSKKKIV